MAEFAYNKTNRIVFKASSADGYLLFRLISQVVVSYGQRVIHIPDGRNPYRSRLKGIWISLVIFSRALIGNYVNFGVFGLYGDPALNNIFDITFKMITILSPRDVIGYKKVGRAYFPLVDVLFTNHMDAVARLDFPSFQGILSTVEAGLQSHDTALCSICASAINSLATQYYT